MATTGSKKSCGTLSHLAESNKGREKYCSFSQNPGRRPLSLSLLVEDNEME